MTLDEHELALLNASSCVIAGGTMLGIAIVFPIIHEISYMAYCMYCVSGLLSVFVGAAWGFFEIAAIVIDKAVTQSKKEGARK